VRQKSKLFYFGFSLTREHHSPDDDDDDSEYCREVT